MKKQIPVASIENELRGRSAFFARQSPIEEIPLHQTPVAPSPRPSTQMDQTLPVAPTPRRTDSSPPHRPKKREAYDIYADQAVAIKRLKARRQLELDRDVSKSEIVREALDFFFNTSPN